MKTREMSGKELIKLTKSDLMQLGFQPNYDLCCKLFKHLKMLSVTYPKVPKPNKPDNPSLLVS